MSSQGFEPQSPLTLGSLTNDLEDRKPTSWTDDLPVCYLSGVGSSTNQIYREDGIRQEAHEFEDRSFHFRTENDIFLYGVFDGHNGSKVSSYVAQNLPAELLFGQLDHNQSDDEIKDVLLQSFLSMEKGFFQFIDDNLAKKCSLMQQIPQGLTTFEQQSKYPDIMKAVQQIDKENSGGTTALVAVIIGNRLFIANAGCSRALICKLNDEGLLVVNQLTSDHNLENELELERLEKLGLDRRNVSLTRKVNGYSSTRGIGDYHLKMFYLNSDLFSSATSSPSIAVPEFSDVIELDESSYFLVLMSDGLYRSVMDAGLVDRNLEIVRLITQQFTSQTTLNGVAQAVVDQVVRLHHDTFMTNPDRRKLCEKRDDITLLIRNFNCPLQSVASPPSANTRSGLVFPPTTQPMTPLSVLIPPMNSNLLDQTSPQYKPFFPAQPPMNTNSTLESINDSIRSIEDAPFKKNSIKSNKLALDEHGRIESYVDFSDFYKAVELLTESQRENLTADMEPKPEFETIPEEKESATRL